MPRLVVEHLKNEKTSRSISIEVDGSIIGEISAGSARDFFIFLGKHTIIAKVGSERSDPIEISIDERDIILFQCWSTGLIKKRVILRSISQKTQKNRFYMGIGRERLHAKGTLTFLINSFVIKTVMSANSSKMT